MEWVEATEEDRKELEQFIHECAVNSLRLLANSGKETLPRRQLRRWGINSGIEVELESMGIVYPADDDVNVIIEQDYLHDYLKNMSAADPAQIKLGLV